MANQFASFYHGLVTCPHCILEYAPTSPTPHHLIKLNWISTKETLSFSRLFSRLLPPCQKTKKKKKAKVMKLNFRISP